VTASPCRRKWNVDAEGLGVRDGIAAVGFEREHRVVEYKLLPDYHDPDRAPARFSGSIERAAPESRFRNGHFLAQARAEPGRTGGCLGKEPRQGRATSSPPCSSGPRKGVFTVKRSGEFDITDGAFLPDGDLLLLERSFSMATASRCGCGASMANAVAKGALADRPILLFEADMSYQIDNMEALDVWTRADGATIVSLMSDDNHSILQRNLYLEFVLHDD
jgi:hypothetical protein